MIPVFIPWRYEECRANIKSWIWENFWRPLEFDGTFKIIEGIPPHGLFNRSAALNDAARQADEMANWNFAIVADADVWVPRPQLMQAVSIATRCGVLTAAYDAILELTEVGTNALMSTGRLDFLEHGVDNLRTIERPWEMESRMLVCPRELWNAIGGFDENFVGWGGEDNAFWKAASVISGGTQRVSGPCFHLWHPFASNPQTRSQDDAVWRQNWERWQQYKQAHNTADIKKLWSGTV